MPRSIVVLTEQALTDGDVERLLALHGDDLPTYRVLVPADVERNLLADVLNHLSLLELREALEAARGHDEVSPQEADQAMRATLDALAAHGAAATGAVVDGDPVSAVEKALAEASADEVVVVTRPHAVEDTFHRDWASQARERLGVPVLHVYAGSSWLG